MAVQTVGQGAIESSDFLEKPKSRIERKQASPEVPAKSKPKLVKKEPAPVESKVVEKQEEPVHEKVLSDHSETKEEIVEEEEPEKALSDHSEKKEETIELDDAKEEEQVPEVVSDHSEPKEEIVEGDFDIDDIGEEEQSHEHGLAIQEHENSIDIDEMLDRPIPEPTKQPLASSGDIEIDGPSFGDRFESDDQDGTNDPSQQNDDIDFDIELPESDPEPHASGEASDVDLELSD